MILLAIVSLACVFQSNLTHYELPTLVPTQNKVLATSTDLPTLTTSTPLPFYTVTGLVYVRDFTGDPVGYIHLGDRVQCRLAGDWCLLENGTKVWSGCLEPNLSDKECKSK